MRGELARASVTSKREVNWQELDLEAARE